MYILSEDDVANADSVLKILEPMKTVTTLLCSENSTTTFLIHPLKEMLLRQMKVRDDDCSLVKLIKTAIIKGHYQRLGTKIIDFKKHLIKTIRHIVFIYII